MTESIGSENKNKLIGVVGLGLIGASLSAALKKSGFRVLGIDKDKSTLDFALLAGTVDSELTKDEIPNCDMVFIAISVDRAEEWLRENAESIGKETVVIDCCGVKRGICALGLELSGKYGFQFIGGHPMAGKQIGGYKNSNADLFKEATFCLVPLNKNDIRLIAEVKEVLEHAGFSRFIVMTPEEHDKVIAFTSQLAHLLSNAYIKSDIADTEEVSSLSGGAFRDMTRVAYLDEEMWTELFIENKDNLLSELEGFIGELEQYRVALESGDRETLSKLLLEGKNRKSELEKIGK